MVLHHRLHCDLRLVACSCFLLLCPFHEICSATLVSGFLVGLATLSSCCWFWGSCLQKSTSNFVHILDNTPPCSCSSCHTCNSMVLFDIGIGLGAWVWCLASRAKARLCLMRMGVVPETCRRSRFARCRDLLARRCQLGDFGFPAVFLVVREVHQEAKERHRHALGLEKVVEVDQDLQH